jgi:thiol-disulfide isomerase/thioredoxin
MQRGMKTFGLPSFVVRFVVVILVLMMISFASSTDSSSSAASIFLTKSEYDSQTFNKTVFIKWAAPWCGHSQDLAPIWDRLVSKTIAIDNDDSILIAEVDCAKESEWCIEMGYIAYPTLTYGDSSMGGIFLQKYKSVNKSYEDLLKFVQEKLIHKSFCTPGNVAACTDEIRDRIQQYSDRSILELKILIEKEESLIDEAEKKFEKRNKDLQVEYDQISKAHESETANIKGQLKLYKNLIHQANKKIQQQ